MDLLLASALRDQKRIDRDITLLYPVSLRVTLARVFQYFFIALGLIHLAIGPSNALQIVAWSKMLIDYSEGRTLIEAAEMTFDGEHPCAMCLSLEETRKEEQKDPAPGPERSLERQELFPQKEIQPKLGRALATANSPPSPARLLGFCRFVPECPTPPPRFV